MALQKKNTKPRSKVVKKECICCHKEKLLSTGYYTASNPLTSSDGEKVNLCKDCYKKMSLNGDGTLNETGFKKALQLMDKPYVEDVLVTAIASCTNGSERHTRGDVLSEYMRMVSSLPQYKGIGFVDSIDNATYVPTGQAGKDLTQIAEEDPDEMVYSEFWRGKYSRRHIKMLDEYYNDLEHDYKIITSNHRDYAKKIAKASLQMDLCFDDMMSGVSGADAKYKAARDTFDQLCKSAKFSEATRSVNDVGISGFAKVSEMVEAHNWIPTHVVMEKDEIDRMLEYLSTITKSL